LLSEAYRRNLIDAASIYASVQGLLNDLIVLQGTAQRTKDFPYARNFYSIALLLLQMFVILVPFGLLGQFHDLGRYAGVERWTTWATIPFSVMVSWIFLTLEKVGENSSNPFEGGVNDVPISMLSGKIESEMRWMLGEEGHPQETPTSNAPIVL
jgi:putative membrane protein